MHTETKISEEIKYQINQEIEQRVGNRKQS